MEYLTIYFTDINKDLHHQRTILKSIYFLGGKTKQDIYEAVDIIHPILRSFKKN